MPLGSIKGRLLFLFFANVLIVVVMSTMVVHLYHQYHDRKDALDLQLHNIDVEAFRAQVNFKTQIQEWKNVLLRGHDPALYDKYFKGFVTAEADTQLVVNRLIELANTYPDLQTKAQSFYDAHVGLGEAYRQGLRLYTPEVANPHRETDKAVRGIDREPILLLVEIEEAIEQIRAEEVQTLQSEYQSAQRWIVIIATATCLLMIGLFIVIVRTGITRPVNALVEHTECLTHGERDLTQRVDPGHTQEITAIAHAVNHFIENIQSLMQGIQESSNSLCDIATRSARANADINGVIHHQQSAIDSVGDAIGEMSNTIGEIATSAETTVTSANDALEQAHKGDEIVDTVIDALQTLVKDVSHTSDAVRQMSEESAQIHSILSFITEITEKTNLLALNAAIEAARAGEHGRGFAVVADEVRALATQTHSATDEIAGVIDKIQGSVNRSLSAIENSSKQADVTIDLAGRAGERLTRVKEAAQHIVDENQQVVASSKQRAIEAAQITQDIQAISETIASTTQKVGKDTSDVADLAQISTVLNSLICQFKVYEGQEQKPTLSNSDQDNSDDLELF